MRSDLRLKSDRQEFVQAWLAERMGHSWTGRAGGTFTDGNRCMFCGRKFGKAAGRFCPSRKKPNRWKLHSRRALMTAQNPTEIPTLDAKWIREQLADCEREMKPYKGMYTIRCRHGKHDVWAQAADFDGRLWKYAPVACRYRKLMRQWWVLPRIPADLIEDDSRANGSFEASMTRGRKALLRQAREQGTLNLSIGQTHYRLVAEAVIQPDRGSA